MSPRIGICGPSYPAQSPNTDAEDCINFYPELVESGAGNAPIVLNPTPGTKKFVELTAVNPPPGAGVGGFLDKATSASGTISPVALSQTPVQNNELGIFTAVQASSGGIGSLVPPGWTGIFDNGIEAISSKLLASTAPVNISQAITNQNWAAALALFGSNGTPTILQTRSLPGTFNLGGVGLTIGFTSNVTKGSVLFFVFLNRASNLERIPVVTSDSLGNTWSTVAGAQVGAVGSAARVYMMAAPNNFNGPCTMTFNLTSGSTEVFLFEISGLAIVPVGLRTIRGQLNIAGRSFAVCGNDFDEVLANGTFVNWGFVANDSKPVTMAASPQQLLLASAGTAYVFDLMANTLTAIPGATFAGPVSQAEICDNFFILTIKNTKRFYVSGVLNANDWVTNGSAIISVFPNNLVSMKVFQRQIWFDSDVESVVYYDSGNIFPFDVNPNAFINYGSAAENGMSVFNNTIAWLGKDKNGQGKVWLAQGYTPSRISNHAVEFAIQGYARIDDAVAFTYQDQGHEFLCFYFPTPSVTWVYDAMTGMWHKQGFWVGAIASFQAAHRQNHVFSFGRHLVGDWQSDIIYEMKIPQLNGSTWTFADDDGAPLHRIRRSPHVSKEQKRLYIDELQVFVETGLGPQPPLLDASGNPRGPAMDMRLSRDSGHTFTEPRTRDCGQSGEFKKRVRWLRLGEARDWVFDIHVSDPIGWRITDAYINPPDQGDN